MSIWLAVLLVVIIIIVIAWKFFKWLVVKPLKYTLLAILISGVFVYIALQ